MAHDQHNARQTLLDLGIGDFNATMIIPYMFVGPAQTDPAMAQIQIITKAMQQQMRTMGATWIRPTGVIDDATAHVLHALVGPRWNETTWGEIARALVVAKRSGKRLHKAYLEGAPGGVVLEGMGVLPDLPSVPGGLVTYGIAAYLLYRHFKKKG